MHTETKSCQNCTQSFQIDSEDFSFYEKIKVPPPTFCPECRMKRRFMWRNERTLYKRTCGLCSKNILAIYAPESPYTVYCPECWRSDGWDAISYGRDYDFSKPFFEQFKELMNVVPRIALNHMNVVSSPFSNQVESGKEVYLAYSIVRSEYIYYCRNVNDSKQLFDSYDVQACEQCFENVTCDKNYGTAFAYFSRSCVDSYFIFDCANVSHCFLCTNLRNGEYFYKNEKYSKEEYEKIISGYKLDTREGLARTKKEFEEMRLNAIHRFAHTINAIDSTGDDIRNCRMVRWGFGSSNCENSKYFNRCPTIKDTYDAQSLIQGELCYEFTNGGAVGSQWLRFCMNCLSANSNMEYSDCCWSASEAFGSICVRNKKYTILNKEYSKEAFQALVPKIREHMNEMPYADKKGNIYRYGEFFPAELSTFAYNESTILEYYPISKSEAEREGHRWREREQREYAVTLKPEQVPDLADATESITKEVIACENKGKEETLCATAFRILPEEFEMYKKFKLALPTKCPNCRYFERATVKNPLTLCHRSCMCTEESHEHGASCLNEFETSYSPERKERVYCEQCYQKSVL